MGTIHSKVHNAGRKSGAQCTAFFALRNELAALQSELQRIEAGAGVDEELMDNIELIAAILGGMRED